MRVLLLSASREHFPEPVFPLGAAYVASALLREGAQVRGFDAGVTPFPLPSLRRALERFSPDIVGLSLRNVDNAAYPRSRCYLPGYVRIACEVRSSSRATLYLGGSAFSIFPEDLMRLLGAGGGATGDGEDGILRLLRGDGGRIVHGRLDDLDSVVFPRGAESVFPGFDRYRAIGVQTARGCPQSCIYCTYPLLEGDALRLRAPEAVADDLAFLSREHGKRDFFFVDSLANADEGHMERVCRALLSRNLRIRFTCYLRPKISDPSLFGLLARAGCVSVEFGTDSGSDTVLSSLGKGFSADDVREASDACRKARIDFCHYLLFGGPGETRETMAETVRLMDTTAPNAVVAMTGLRIYPRTALHRIAIREGILSPGDSLLGPRHYFSGGDPSWVLEQAGEAAARRRNWFLPGRRDWSRALAPRLLRLIRPVGPLWRAFRKAKGRS
jgi:radical SAM superfamily enzyme YgiQ (UPF0313 family)